MMYKIVAVGSHHTTPDEHRFDNALGAYFGFMNARLYGSATLRTLTILRYDGELNEDNSIKYNEITIEELGEDVAEFTTDNMNDACTDSVSAEDFGAK